MAYTRIALTGISALLLSFVFFQPKEAEASTTATLAVTAVVYSSATITLSDNSAPASTLSFSGTPDSTASATEGTITVSAKITTSTGNADVQIQVMSTDLTGERPSNVIPASDLSYTHSTDTGGGSWYSGSLSNNWSTLAKLDAGSGLYTGDQKYRLNIPPTANDDTYSATISYRVVGF